MTATVDTNPFEVLVMDGGKVLARADAETADAILFAGQTLYDDCFEGSLRPGKLTVIFLYGGIHVRTVTGRPS